MFEDEEVNLIYLGKPLEEGTGQLGEDPAPTITFSEEEIRRIFLSLPLMSRLLNVPCAVGG